MNFGFAPDPLGAWWPESLALLAPAIERGDSDQVELEEALACGVAQLWTADTGGAPLAAMVTTGDDETLDVWLAGGRIVPDCLPFLGIVERIAKEGGAKRAVLRGRKGWSRLLKGWRVEGELLVKDL